jgi:hypothetical protein
VASFASNESGMTRFEVDVGIVFSFRKRV